MAGDENRTTVPSMIYPLSDTRRDDFYANSSVNVFKGDHVRFDFIRLAYDLPSLNLKAFPFKALQFYLNIENIGILWRSNEKGLDPDYDIFNMAYPVPKRFAAGFKIDF